MLTRPSRVRTATFCGADGRAGCNPDGVIGADGSDGALTPEDVVATTVNVTAAPFVRPATRAKPAEANSAAVIVAVAPVDAVPVNAVTVYEATAGAPPRKAGGFQATMAAPSPAGAAATRDGAA